MTNVAKLKWNPYPIHDGDRETFSLMGFCWNVDAMKRYAKEEHLEPVHTKLNDAWANWLTWIKLDREKALKNTSVEPIIMAEIFPGQTIPVDGHHRAYRDLESKKPTIATYVLPYPLHTRFLVDRRLFDMFVDCVKNEAKDKIREATNKVKEEYGLL